MVKAKKPEQPLLETLPPDEYQVTEFEKPDPAPFDQPSFSPQELLDRMQLAAWEYRQAIEAMRKLETSKNVREKKTMTIIGARQFDMLTNTKLRDYLYATFTADPKLRPTKEQYESWVYLEHQHIFDQYRYWEAQAKQAEKDHEHWGRQLSWYQSDLKQQVAELYALNLNKG